MEVSFVVLLVAFVVVLVVQHLEHNMERDKWYEERQFLLDRIQAPQLVEAKRSEAIEPGGVSYVGDESDTAGITGDRGDDGTAAP